MSKLIYAHNNERINLGEFTPEKVADLIIAHSWFLPADLANWDEQITGRAVRGSFESEVKE